MANPPALTPEQRSAALQKAAEARAARAELKEKLKMGSVTLSDALAKADSNDVIGKLKVVALLESLPHVNGAMFALLPPGGKLNRHRDPFAGSLRYHLGLVCPDSDDCRIFVDGEPYSWRDGQDVLFDETFIHSAENKTDVTRIILFCDVERPLRTRWMTAVNRWVSRNVIRGSATQNVENEQVGTFNRIYALFGQSSDLLTKLKRRNRTAFRAVKYALIAGLVYWIFVQPLIATS